MGSIPTQVLRFFSLKKSQGLNTSATVYEAIAFHTKSSQITVIQLLHLLLLLLLLFCVCVCVCVYACHVDNSDCTRHTIMHTNIL